MRQRGTPEHVARAQNFFMRLQLLVDTPRRRPARRGQAIDGALRRGLDMTMRELALGGRNPASDLGPFAVTRYSMAEDVIFDICDAQVNPTGRLQGPMHDPLLWAVRRTIFDRPDFIVLDRDREMATYQGELESPVPPIDAVGHNEQLLRVSNLVGDYFVANTEIVQLTSE